MFDLMLAGVLDSDPISGDDIASMGLGGLCLQCEVCHYPICPFGK
jgi:hypothetical protein